MRTPDLKKQKTEKSKNPLESKRHFVSKELRYSLALIIIISLAAGIIFIYLAKLLGMVISHVYVPFIIMAGYVIIVVALTMIFSHRFIGPFPRLKMEIRIILGGEYSRRLHIRAKDDIYIKSFIEELNRLLNEFERMHLLKQELIQSVEADLEALYSCISSRDMSREELVKCIQSCRINAGELLKRYRYKYTQEEGS